ncbi:type II secretion system F family protein [Streptomyces sp. PR69]|uniref:type II secretion system F family protein n=1 Tax=Streptomyces sp. PR69 TaxID=2984950 RepID=UPI0022641A3B|nr:type II secretion system F family protein [Streptomyces sp. PR69]
MYAAALCAGAAAWLMADGEQGLRRGRLLLAGGGAVAPSQGRAVDRVRTAAHRLRRQAGARREWWCVPAALVVAMLGESLLPLIAGAVAVPLLGRRLRAAEHARERERRAQGVVTLCGAVVGELRAGLQPGPALASAVRSTGALGGGEAGVLAAARFGGDVPGALREAARAPGAEGLAGMAACWRVAVDGGAGLAEGLDRLESALRARRDQREELRAQLAGAWSTVLLLALLPLAGLAMGTALGAEPLRVLLHTPAGLVCLTAGGLLESAGLYWAGRIVRRGEPV